MATLVKVLPDQINEIWELVDYAIRQTSIKPDVNQVLEGLLLGNYMCWLGMEEEEAKIVIITRIVDESFLLIHTAFVYGRLEGEDYIRLFRQLVKYGEAVGCDSIIFYTENDKLCEFAERHGARVSKFVTIPIGG